MNTSVCTILGQRLTAPASILHLSRFSPSLFLCPLLCGCCLLWSGFTTAAETTRLRISADIAPIHSLVSLVVGDRMSVELIVPSNQSPHDFALKPSQVRSINQSDLIVFVSEGFTPSLSRYLKTLNRGSALLNLADTLTSETQDEQTEDEHAADSHDHHPNDEHTWLDPRNAIVWLAHIADVVATLDESNRAEYQQNSTKAIAEIRATHLNLIDKLANVSDVPYIVYHDAYQHFAHSFNLADPLAIALSDARAPGAAKIKQIRTAAVTSKCVFAEVQHDDAMVDTVSSGLSVKRGTLDPLGSEISIGPGLYSALMQNLAQSFIDCLSE